MTAGFLWLSDGRQGDFLHCKPDKESSLLRYDVRTDLEIPAEVKTSLERNLTQVVGGLLYHAFLRTEIQVEVVRIDRAQQRHHISKDGHRVVIVDDLLLAHFDA